MWTLAPSPNASFSFTSWTPDGGVEILLAGDLETDVESISREGEAWKDMHALSSSINCTHLLLGFLSMSSAASLSNPIDYGFSKQSLSEANHVNIIEHLFSRKV